MLNVTNEPSWFRRNKQTVVLTVAVLLLAIFAGVAIYASATTQFHMI